MDCLERKIEEERMLLVVTLDDLLSPGLHQEGGVGVVGLPVDLLPVPEVVAGPPEVSVVVLRPAEEPVEGVEAAPGWPVLLIAESEVPLQEDC